jgi:hypothetical protein
MKLNQLHYNLKQKNSDTFLIRIEGVYISFFFPTDSTFPTLIYEDQKNICTSIPSFVVFSTI